MQKHPLDLSLDGFDPLPRLTEIAPAIRAALLLCCQGDHAVGLTARRMEQDEQTGIELIDSLADAERYLRALAAVVENAELRLLAAITA
ncbi:hypothetical protein [Pseudochrobactrum sp. B5]|uniref:hypothetical protein n=1 Tax=Pseudochrobactrum sp. B5 TaxID=1289478 RepID=UPI0009513E63|nr:hypothetical protein [Pseudochrobactrum sp. B5]